MQFLYSMFSPEEPTMIESRSDGTALSSGGDVTDVSVNRSHLGWEEERGDDDDDSDNDNNDNKVQARSAAPPALLFLLLGGGRPEP